MPMSGSYTDWFRNGNFYPVPRDDAERNPIGHIVLEPREAAADGLARALVDWSAAYRDVYFPRMHTWRFTPALAQHSRISPLAHLCQGSAE